jgi:hypothetical protein
MTAKRRLEQGTNQPFWEALKGKRGFLLRSGWIHLILAVLVAGHAVSAQHVVVVNTAGIDIKVVRGSGRVAACGIQVKAPYSVGLDAVRTWDLTFYLVSTGKSTGIAVDALSYDVPTAGAKPEVRPAPTELAFSVKGNTEVFNATSVRPSQSEGASLAMIVAKGARQILAALETGTPVVVYYSPKGADTEVVIVSGTMKPGEADTFGQCFQAMKGI